MHISGNTHTHTHIYIYPSIRVNGRIATDLEPGIYSGKMTVLTTYHCTEVPNLGSPVSGGEVSGR
jgi:hypothetical protein